MNQTISGKSCVDGIRRKSCLVLLTSQKIKRWLDENTRKIWGTLRGGFFYRFKLFKSISEIPKRTWDECINYVPCLYRCWRQRYYHEHKFCAFGDMSITLYYICFCFTILANHITFPAIVGGLIWEWVGGASVKMATRFFLNFTAKE